jgi:hypothetical protein
MYSMQFMIFLASFNLLNHVRCLGCLVCCYMDIEDSIYSFTVQFLQAG